MKSRFSIPFRIGKVLWASACHNYTEISHNHILPRSRNTNIYFRQSTTSAAEAAALNAITSSPTSTVLSASSSSISVSNQDKVPSVRRRRRRFEEVPSDISATSELPTSPPSQPQQLSSSSRSSIGSKLAHYDFDTFLDHLERTGKSTTSTTSVGTLYEYATITALERLGFRSLTRCGRSGDNGVDITGICRVSTVQSSIEELKSNIQNSIFQVISNEAAGSKASKAKSQEFNVIVQCKASEKSVSSLLMREMAGAYFGFINSSLQNSLSDNPSANTMVLVITAGGRLTAPAFKQLEASQIPMVYMCLEKPRCDPAENKYNPSSYKLFSISQVTPNKLAKDFLQRHGLSFRTVRSYVLKSRADHI